MSTEILMPALSPTMEEGTLSKWLVKEGDHVKSGDLLAEIETDKATMEFEAASDGVIGRLLVAEGTEGVRVNAPIAVLLEEGESADDIGPADRSPAPGPAHHTASPPPESSSPQPESEGKPLPVAHRDADGARLFASPLARRIAAERGLDLNGIAGSGPHGRIVKADVVSAVASPARRPEPLQASEAAPAPSAPHPGPSTDQILAIYEGRDFEEISLDGMRRTIAARLAEAKQSVPHFYLRREIRLDALMRLRGEMNVQLAPRGIKLSVNDFIIKASALALQATPEANAVWAGDRMLRLKASDVAVAVAVEGGLFTPVLRDAEQKSLSALSEEMKDLAKRAKERKLKPQEYMGGTMAISNLGMYGIENFDAIINPPHAAILAVGAGLQKPVVGDDGEVRAATLMSVTLSVDHRVIDGVLGARLLGQIVSMLENPMLMLV